MQLQGGIPLKSSEGTADARTLRQTQVVGGRSWNRAVKFGFFSGCDAQSQWEGGRGEGRDYSLCTARMPLHPKWVERTWGRIGSKQGGGCWSPPRIFEEERTNPMWSHPHSSGAAATWRLPPSSQGKEGMSMEGLSAGGGVASGSGQRSLVWAQATAPLLACPQRAPAALRPPRGSRAPAGSSQS